MSLGHGCLMALSSDLSREFDGINNQELLLQGDNLSALGIEQKEIRKHISMAINQIRPNNEIQHIAEISWSAVLSASIDSHFERTFQRWADRSPARPNITAITNLSQPIPPRTIPVYKLLGSIQSDDFVITSNDYRLRKTQWRQALGGFCNNVQGSPTLCLGMAECRWLLLDLLFEMLSEPRYNPGPILVFEEDPISSDYQLKDMSSRGLRVNYVGIPLAGALDIIKKFAVSARTPSLPFEKPMDTPLEKLSSFEDIAVLVNCYCQTQVSQDETHLLRDLLFSPNVANWDPFVYDLDFPRTIMSELLDSIDKAVCNKNEGHTAVVVHGASSTGKTTLMKRAAFELAKKNNYHILWLRPYFYQDGPNQIRKLATCMAEDFTEDGKRIIIFVDDPVGLGSIKVEDIRAEFDSTNINTAFVIGTRDSDITLSDYENTLDSFVNTISIGVPDQFDEHEWNMLPEYLVKIGISHSKEEAEKRVAAAANKGTCDILTMLFWLLPETRRHITQSVRGEHLRLGDRAAFSRLIIGEYSHTSSLVKDAYELVAVASKYDTPLPIEVLVSTIKIGYSDWIDATQSQGLVWGIFYQEKSDTSESTVYRTRNSVVTDILIEAINGGTFGHSGELECLRRMIRACDGTSPAYREFYIRVLVPHNRDQLKHLEYSEGVELYNEAIDNIRFEDRTLVHHKGLWEKNKGRNPIEARSTLNKAIYTAVYPYTSRTEAREHIYTSIAATELDAIKLRHVSPEDGKRKVFEALEKARPAQILDPYAVHIQAGLIIKLAEITSKAYDPDSASLMCTALADVDRMLIMLTSYYVNDSQRRHEIEMLEQSRLNILENCAPNEYLKEDADLMWREFKRQDGFILMARKLYSKAAFSKSGTDYNNAYKYCIKIKACIEEKDEKISVAFIEVLLHIYFEWRIRRYTHSEASELIDWQFIHDSCSAVVASIKSKYDPFYNYLLAIAKAHLGDWPSANMLFDGIRRSRIPNKILFEPRDFLMGPRGNMQSFQGTLKKGAQSHFIHIKELNADFLLNRSESWGRDGEIEHVYLQFSFGGPWATKKP